MSIMRMKLVVNTVKRHADNNGDISAEEITMQAVYSDKEGSANKSWSKWTPCAQFSFTVNNPACFEKLLPGMFLYADLTSTDKDSL